MVVPFTKEGEDIRQVLEADVNKRAVLTELHLKSFVSNFWGAVQIPNSFYYWIMFNLSNFLGSLHICDTTPLA